MQKTLLVPLALAFALAGCSMFKTSQTWQRVVDHRADRMAATDKATYADRLHAVLAADKVEHKVVSYQFRYRTRLREEAMGAGTAVIYRDPATSGSPWWVMDENSALPVWVPDTSPDRQLSFFLRRRAEVLEQRDFPEGAAGDGKALAPAWALALRGEAPSLDGSFEALFRAAHGSRFDPQSRTDREKMRLLRHTVALRTD